MDTLRRDYPNLDFLRACAVLLVLVTHLLHTIMSKPPSILGLVARFGVLAFFVHTALVLMMSLERSSGSAKEFYIRRAFRIYPLALVCILVVVLLRVPREPLDAFVLPHWKTILENVTLTQNLFGGDLASVSAPLWSLPYEVQMYIFLPLIFWLLTKYPRPALLWLFGLIIALLPVRIVGPLFKSTVRFFPCFLSGVLAFYLMKRTEAKLPAYLWPVAVLAAIALFLITGKHFETYAEWFGCLILGLAIPHFHSLQQEWVRVTAHNIATYSYGIYLFHLPLIWLCFVVLHRFRWPAFVSLLLLLSVGLFYLVEQPMISLGSRIASRL